MGIETISGQASEKVDNSGWENLVEKNETSWDDLKNVEFRGGVQNESWYGPEQVEKLEEMGVKSFKIFMRPPPIEKTIGLRNGEWRKVQARFDDLGEWSPERLKLHEQIIDEMMPKIDALSQRLRQHEIEEGRGPTIYCLRGTCGSGKSRALRNGLFEGILDENGKPSGTLAPDVLKTPLRGGVMNHAQVHDESAMLNREISRIVHKKALEEPYSMVYDKLMAYETDFEDVFKDAKETNREVAILDMDVPLELSAVRVLTRTKTGEDPILDFDGVANAFASVRKNRSALIKQMSENGDRMSSYTLRAFDPEVKEVVEVAKLRDGRIKALPGKEKIAERAVVSTDEEIDEEVEKVKNTVITEDFIKYFDDRYFDDESKRFAVKNIAALREYMGKTLSEALNDKSK